MPRRVVAREDNALRGGWNRYAIVEFRLPDGCDSVHAARRLLREANDSDVWITHILAERDGGEPDAPLRQPHEPLHDVSGVVMYGPYNTSDRPAEIPPRCTRTNCFNCRSIWWGREGWSITYRTYHSQQYRRLVCPNCLGGEA